MTTAVDPTFWTVARRFGAAGGARVHVLTEAGRERAFAVGARVKPGAPVRALLALAALGGEAQLVTWRGAKGELTELGRHFGGETWGYLAALGYVEPMGRDGYRLTEAGRVAVDEGHAEQDRLLERVRAAHPTATEAA